MSTIFVALQTLFALSGIIFLLLKETWKPIHQRKGLWGSRWHLPPGPPGVPLFGNLLQWRNARRSPKAFYAYVSRLPWVFFSQIVDE